MITSCIKSSASPLLALCRLDSFVDVLDVPSVCALRQVSREALAEMDRPSVWRRRVAAFLNADAAQLPMPQGGRGEQSLAAVGRGIELMRRVGPIDAPTASWHDVDASLHYLHDDVGGDAGELLRWAGQEVSRSRCCQAEFRAELHRLQRASYLRGVPLALGALQLLYHSLQASAPHTRAFYTVLLGAYMVLWLSHQRQHAAQTSVTHLQLQAADARRAALQHVTLQELRWARQLFLPHA